MNNNLFIKDRMVVGDDDLLIVNDKNVNKCLAPHGRLFELLGKENGKRIVREIACNTVVVGGAITALECLTGATPNWRPDSINSKVGVSAVPYGPTKLVLFGIGNGAASSSNTQIIKADIKQTTLRNLIPLRYNTILPEEEADRYYLRRLEPIRNATKYYWYVKEILNDPVIKACWKNSTNPNSDGVEILSDIDTVNTNTLIETFCEIQIDLAAADGYEYLRAKSEALRYNEIGFFTGSKNEDGNEYANVRLYSTVSFANRQLRNQASTLIYRVYSLI